MRWISILIDEDDYWTLVDAEGVASICSISWFDVHGKQMNGMNVYDTTLEPGTRGLPK